MRLTLPYCKVHFAATTVVGRVCQSGSDLRARRACQPTRID